MGNTEEAFEFYKSVFGTEYEGPITRVGDMAPADGQSEVAPEDANKILHIELPILAGHLIMATDMLASAGHQVRIGNNTTINLEFDDRAETERIYGLLSVDSTESAPLMDMPWGSYWGVCLDRFGIRWMFNCPN
jgi:PhnB protein